MGKFLTFTFDGINSSKYNVYVINEGDSITLPSSPSFTDQVAAPAYQNVVYYLGTNISSKTFTIKCLAKDVTMKQYQEMMRWLSIEKVGKLVLDSSPYFYSTVKISSFSETSLLSDWDHKKDTYQATFNLQFTTIGDYAQQNINPYNYYLDLPYTSYDYLDPVYKLPMIWYDHKVKVLNTKEIYLVNYNSLPMFLDIKIGATSSFAVWKHMNRTPVKKGKWKIVDGKPIATAEDGTTWELDKIPSENNVYYVTDELSYFNNREYEKDSILIARHGSWFKETVSTLCDDLYYNYDMINFEPEEDDNGLPLWNWEVYDVNIKSQYGFITDEQDNKLIEVTINQQLEKLEDLNEKWKEEGKEQRFKGIPDYFNNGILKIDPSEITFIPVKFKLDYSKSTHISKREYWLDLVADDSFNLKLSPTSVNGSALDSGSNKHKSFIYFTYSEETEEGYVQKSDYIEITGDINTFKHANDSNTLQYKFYNNRDEYERLEKLLAKENIKVEIVTLTASVIKINSLLTSLHEKELTLTSLSKFTYGSKLTTTYMLGFDKFTEDMLENDQPTEKLLKTDIEYLHFVPDDPTDPEKGKWCVNRTYQRLPIEYSNKEKQYTLTYRKGMVDDYWDDSRYSSDTLSSIAADHVETKARTYVETQEEFNSGFNSAWNNLQTRETIKCKIHPSGTSIKRYENEDKSAKIYSNCFKTIKASSDEVGMYTHMGDIYLHIKKSEIKLSNTSSDLDWQIEIEKYLTNIGCFFFFETDRYNSPLEELDQIILESSDTRQVVCGQSSASVDNEGIIGPLGEFGPGVTEQRYFISNPANKLILKQKGSSVDLELKLRNQF